LSGKITAQTYDTFWHDANKTVNVLSVFSRYVEGPLRSADASPEIACSKDAKQAIKTFVFAMLLIMTAFEMKTRRVLTASSGQPIVKMA
jgi:hypothetical protein